MSSVNVNPESAEARQIDRANFNRAIGAIQNLSRLHFDKNHFQISWHGPIPIIRLRRGAHHVEDTATREALGVTPEGTETADTSTGNNSDGTWAWSDQATTKGGVTLKITTRVVYDDTSDETLYGFHRTLEFDRNGHLVDISAETRYTIDAPAAC